MARRINQVGQRRLKLEQLEDRRVLATLVVDSLADNTATDGQITLREAVIAANTDTVADLLDPTVQAGSGDDVIRFHPSLNMQSIRLEMGTLPITESLRIEGNGRFETTIDAGNSSGFFVIDNSDTSSLADVFVQNVTLTNASVDAFAVVNQENLTLSHVRLTENSSSLFSHTLGSFTIEDSVIDRNSSGPSNTFSISPTNRFEFRDTVLRNNKNWKMDVTSFFANVTFENTSALENHRGTGDFILVQNFGGNLNVDGLEMSRNDRSDGAMFHVTSDFEARTNIQNVEISDNAATGLYVVAAATSETHVKGAHISGNEVRGLDMFTRDEGLLVFEDATVAGNRIAGPMDEPDPVFAGGILINNSGGQSVLRQVTVTDNFSPGQGGGIYVRRSRTVPDLLPVRIEHSTIVGNVAGDESGRPTGGGGLFSESDVQISHSVIANNVANGSMENDIGFNEDVTSNFEYTFVGDNFGSGLAEANPDANGNLVGGPLGGVLDPHLESKAVNGGFAETLLPRLDSPLVDAGAPNANLPGNDQRGAPFLRVIGQRVDIGAVELEETFIVDLAADEVDGDLSAGDLSLREAIETANSMEGPQRVAFDSALSGQTIPIQLGQIDILDHVNIVGASDLPITLNAEGNSSHFVVGSSSTEVIMSDLKLVGGFAVDDGGAIFSNGSMQLVDMEFSGNLAIRGGGAVATRSGSIEVVGTRFLDNAATDGGAIYVAQGGTLTVDSSAFRNNLATNRGGGLAVVGDGSTAVISRSDMVRNNVTSSGGGIAVSGASHVRLEFSTLAENSAAETGGAILVANENGRPIVEVHHSTIAHNIAIDGPAPAAGGGIRNQGAIVDLYQALLANNRANGQSNDVDNLEGDLLLASYSLLSNGEGSGLDELIPDDRGNLVGGPNLGVLDAKLKPLNETAGLMNYGLLLASPAVNAGDPDYKPNVEYDQRGEPFRRIEADRVDIGAIESRPEIVVDILGDISNGDVSQGDVSLREAVELASQGAVGAIQFDPALEGTIELTDGELLVAGTVDIIGPGADRLAVSGNGNSRVFRIDDGSPDTPQDVSISGLTIRDGDTATNGGGIYSTERLELNRVSILHNKAGMSGGGLFQKERRVAVNNSTLAFNEAGSGGGVAISDSSGSFNQTTISNNLAENGGGVFAPVSALGFTSSTIAFNSSTGANTTGGIDTRLLFSENTVIATNGANGLPADLRVSFDLVIFSSFVGTNAGTSLVEANPDAAMNRIGGPISGVLDPRLLPLGDNGGPTPTHVPRDDSLLIDNGDLFGLTPELDQRGEPFARIVNEVIDIGAVERQMVGPGGIADINRDGVRDCEDINELTTAIAIGDDFFFYDINQDSLVNYDDVVEWLTIVGNDWFGAPIIAGDMNLDGSVDVSDFAIWNSNKFTGTQGWCNGDVNADGNVDVGDFAVWNRNKFTSVFPLPDNRGVDRGYTRVSQQLGRGGELENGSRLTEKPGEILPQPVECVFRSWARLGSSPLRSEESTSPDNWHEIVFGELAEDWLP